MCSVADDTGGSPWTRLLEGNRRYAAGQPAHPDQAPARRQELVAGQHPFAAILGCADSRVPPEILFDQGLGSLFVVRVAGNIVDDVVLGSLEYAAEHLGVSLIVVLGHTHCGAVHAAAAGGAHEGAVARLIEALRPAVEVARTQPGDLVNHAVRANVVRAVGQLRDAQPVLAAAAAQGRLQITGAIYDLSTGMVQETG